MFSAVNSEIVSANGEGGGAGGEGGLVDMSAKIHVVLLAISLYSALWKENLNCCFKRDLFLKEEKDEYVKIVLEKRNQ